MVVVYDDIEAAFRDGDVPWRMAIAKVLLRRRGLALAEVAERVGYGSASAFSTAFSRCVGQPPSRCARGAELGGRA